MIIDVLSYWSQDVSGYWRPRVAVSHTLEGGWHDVTGGKDWLVPPDPNAAVFRCKVSEATAAAIAVDSDMYIMNYSDDIPTTVEYAQWRTYITSMRDDASVLIWNTGQFNQAVGPLPVGRTWDEIMPDMLDYCIGLVR